MSTCTATKQHWSSLAQGLKIKHQLLILTSIFLVKAYKSAIHIFKVRTATCRWGQVFTEIPYQTYKSQGVFFSHCSRTKEDRFS